MHYKKWRANDNIAFGRALGFAPYEYVKLIALISHTDGYSAKDVHYEYRLILCLNLKTREFGRLKELLLNININYWQEPEILLLIIVKTSTRNLSLLFS